MESSKDFYNTLDTFRIGGLGCGIIGLCCLAFGFIYTFRNPPSQRPAAIQTLPKTTDFSTTTPDSSTPTLSIMAPTLFPTLTAMAPTDAGVATAAPLPDF